MVANHKIISETRETHIIQECMVSVGLWENEHAYKKLMYKHSLAELGGPSQMSHDTDKEDTPDKAGDSSTTGQEDVHVDAKGTNIKKWKQTTIRNAQTQDRVHLYTALYSIRPGADDLVRANNERHLSRALAAAAKPTINKLKELAHKGRSEETHRSLLDAAQAAVSHHEQALKTPAKQAGGETPVLPQAPPTVSKVAVKRATEAKNTSDTFELRQAVFRQNALEIEKYSRETSTEADKTISKSAICFLNPYSKVDLGTTYDDGTPLFEAECVITKKKFLYELESKAESSGRAKEFKILKRTTSKVPKHVLEGVDNGDVYGYFVRVMQYYDDVGRPRMIERIDREITNFRVQGNELFVALKSRYSSLRTRMKELGYKQDVDGQWNMLRKCFINHEATRHPYESVILSHPSVLKLRKCDELLEKMTPMMENAEQLAKEQARRDRGKSKGKGQPNQQQQKTKVKVNKLDSKKQTSKPTGICLRDAETGKCPFEKNCRYEHHGKVSKAAFEGLLKERGLEKRADGKGFTKQVDTKKEKKSYPRKAKVNQLSLSKIQAALDSDEDTDSSDSDALSKGEKALKGNLRKLKSKGMSTEMILEVSKVLIDQN